MAQTLKVLIIAADAVSRRCLSSLIAPLPDIQEVAVAANSAIALAKLKKEASDIIMLDTELPDSLQTLKSIRNDYPEAGVIMISGVSETDAGRAIEALQAGALDVLPKQGAAPPESAVLELKNRITAVMGIYTVRRNLRNARRLTREKAPAVPSTPDIRPPAVPGPAAKTIKTMAPVRVDVVVIGVSTGGPNALAELIPGLPPDLNVPVLLVQHMPAFLTSHLAANLDKKSALTVQEAREGMELNPNIVYIAPGGRHMTIQKNSAAADGTAKRIIRLNSDPPENSCRPAVDVLFRSVAGAYDGAVLSVIMTGMGNDGMKGIQALKEKGCYCLSQTEDTCVVYGMPKAVDDAGFTDESVPLEKMAERISAIVKKTEGGSRAYQQAGI